MTEFAYYLFKMIICSGIFFLYYQIALRNKFFHRWNRFYLLMAVVLSILAPILQLTIYHYVDAGADNSIQILQVVQSANDYLEEMATGANPAISIDQWSLTLYAIVSAALLTVLIFSLTRLFFLVRSHTVRKMNKIKFINTNVKGTPFSFFQFIFWNEAIDPASDSGLQIFNHELVHVKEKHTLDKIFMQLVIIAFWCNPFFWLIRKELKMIHEFIADKKAVAQSGTASFAAMILHCAYPGQFNSITNQFFQTSIKRRLTMLSKIQHPRLNYLSRLIALPVIVMTVLAFTIRTRNIGIPSAHPNNKITVVIDAGHGQENGKYTGARSGKYYEDVINLAISKKIQELNNNDHLNILLTRTSSENVGLHRRVEIADEKKADMFVSIHINAMTEPGDSSGMEVLVSGKNTAYQVQSETLGSVLLEELNSIYPSKQFLRKSKSGVWVIDQNHCPSVLIECGYLTNAKDRDFISQEKNQTLIAQQILEGIERYAVFVQQGLGSSVDSVPSKKTNKASSAVSHKATGKTKPSPANVVKRDPRAPKAKKVELVSENAKPSPAARAKPQSDEPICIVDGKIFKGSLSDLKTTDIESVNVLKQDAAVAKYGEKGRNGAIEVSTIKNTDH